MAKKQKPAVKKRLKVIFADGTDFTTTDPTGRQIYQLEKLGVPISAKKPIEGALRLAWVQCGAPGKFQAWVEALADFELVDEPGGEPGER